MDTMEAVAAEVAAGLRISQRLAAERVGYARSMHERLPQVAQVFAAGDIGYHAFTTIVSRTDLIVDPDVLAKVDRRVAVNVGRWPSLTRGRLAAKVDAIVARVDADAVRRRKERHAGTRDLDLTGPGWGLRDRRQPVQYRCSRPGPTLECVGGHRL